MTALCEEPQINISYNMASTDKKVWHPQRNLFKVTSQHVLYFHYMQKSYTPLEAHVNNIFTKLFTNAGLMDAALVNYWQDLTRNFTAALASAHDRQRQRGLAGRDDCSMEDKGLLEDMRFHMESLTI